MYCNLKKIAISIYIVHNTYIFLYMYSSLIYRNILSFSLPNNLQSTIKKKTRKKKQLIFHFKLCIKCFFKWFYQPYENLIKTFEFRSIIFVIIGIRFMSHVISCLPIFFVLFNSIDVIYLCSILHISDCFIYSIICNVPTLDTIYVFSFECMQFNTV